MSKSMLAIIDATSLSYFEKLTLHRAPGALPFAGRYRLIDFALSNIKNSGITNVAIFPRGNYRSLQDHVGSGKRWNLDRRRDGLFILPPKNMMVPTEEALTFQRMHEHIEYFNRGSQEYVLLTQPDIVWSIDFNDALRSHIESGAEITEIMNETYRLSTFIIAKKALLSYINDYDIIPFKTINDVILKKESLSVNIHHHTGYTRKLTTPRNYLKTNLDMLDFEIGRTIFKMSHPIVTKEKTAPPARYHSGSRVKNAMVSSGSTISGHVENSIIGRDCIIKKDAHVKDSVLMSGAIVETGATVQHAIIDKGVIVKKGTVIEGSARHPFVTEKSQVLTEKSDLSVLLVASEAHPYIKTGGLADVVGGLSRALSRIGLRVSVVLPLYKAIKENYSESYRYVTTQTFPFGGEEHKVRIFSLFRKKVRFYFIEHFPFFERDDLYGYEDDCRRFAFFNLCVRHMIEATGPFDIVHLNDWHTGLIPKILNATMDTPPKTMLTIHNIDYQGLCDESVLKDLNLPYEHDREINFLAEGIAAADKLTTVSATYRNELGYDYYGKNLTRPLMKRERDFHGVLNGLPSEFSPQKDKVILSQYDRSNPFAKTENKLFLQEKMNLKLGLDRFVIGMVSRITEQKGFPLVIEILEEVLSNHSDIQFVLLGQGDPLLIEPLREIEAKFPGRMKLNIGYDATEPSYIYAGADLFLMPSRVEPCGLGQMIALRFGTIPLVRKTGGLADSVIDYDPITGRGNGFTFFDYDPDHLKERLIDAHRLFKEDKTAWKKLIDRAMKSDFSLDNQARKILEIYLTML